MSDTIRANVSRMFSEVEPWDCSNSIANLGQSASSLTWQAALLVASNRREWMRSKVSDACDGMRDWAVASGGWERSEVDAWSTDECLALFVQNVASDLRDNLGSDDSSLEDCAAKYESTDWERESSYPTGCYYIRRASVFVDFYTGC